MARRDRYWSCSCTPYSQDAGGGNFEHLAEWDPDCPIHGQGKVFPPDRRLVAAGVIRPNPAPSPPGLRAVAIVVDAGHPRGPIAGKVIWDVQADAQANVSPPLRCHALDDVFQRAHAALQEADQETDQ